MGAIISRGSFDARERRNLRPILDLGKDCGFFEPKGMTFPDGYGMVGGPHDQAQRRVACWTPLTGRCERKQDWVKDEELALGLETDRDD